MYILQSIINTSTPKIKKGAVHSGLPLIKAILLKRPKPVDTIQISYMQPKHKLSGYVVAQWLHGIIPAFERIVKKLEIVGNSDNYCATGNH